MQNSTWKLAALAGVVGIGFLVVLQTQRGLSRRDVAVDEQAAADDQEPQTSRDPIAELAFGTSHPDPKSDDATSTPVPRRSSASEFPSTPQTDGDLASGQSEPPSGTGPDNDSSRPSTDPFAPSSASINPPNRGSAAPDDGKGLDFRSPGTKTAPAATGPVAKDPDRGNPFATVPPAASTVTPAGGTKPDQPTADTKSPASPSLDAPKKGTSPFAENLFPADTAPAASPTPAGPTLVSPGGSTVEDKSSKPVATATPSKDLPASTAGTGTGTEKTLSPQPATAFPDSTPPPSVATPSPKPDAFNPFEPAPATAQSQDSRPKPLPTAGPSKAPRLIAPALPSSAVGNKSPRSKSSDASGSSEKPKPTLAKPIRVLDKQPLPPKSIADPKPSSATSRHTGDSKSSTKTKPPQRLDIPKQVTPLKTKAPDVAVGHGATASGAPQGPQKPQLKIEKIAPKNAILGQPMVYRILVRNIGHATAHQVVVKDHIPQGVQLTGTIPQAYLTGRLLSWRLGTLKPNEVRRISVRVVPQTAGEIGSIATVNFISKVAARTTVTAPKLSLSISAPKTIPLGQSVQFHFKITNNGSSEAREVFIRDIIPPELKHAAGPDLEYKIGTLPAGKTKDIRLTMKAVKSGDAVNRAVVTADGGLKVEATAAVRITDQTRLTVTRTGPRKRYVGQTALYTNRVTNRTDGAVIGIRLVESVPAGMDVIKTTPAGRYDPQHRSVTWSIQRLDAGKSRDLKVTLRALKTGSQESAVAVIALDGSRANVRSLTSVKGLAALRIDVPPVSGPVDVGNPVALRIVAANRGSAPATNVQITVTLSEELVVASVRGPVKSKSSAAKIQFEPIESIAPGKEVVLDVILRSVKPGDARVSVKTRSDQMSRPLVREDAVQILADGQ